MGTNLSKTLDTDLSVTISGFGYPHLSVTLATGTRLSITLGTDLWATLGTKLKVFRLSVNHVKLCTLAVGFQVLVDKHMLTGQQEKDLVDSLQFKEEDRWLQLLYRCKCRSVDTWQDDTEQCLDTLERAPIERMQSQPEASPAQPPRGQSGSCTLLQHKTFVLPDQIKSH